MKNMEEQKKEHFSHFRRNVRKIAHKTSWICKKLKEKRCAKKKRTNNNNKNWNTNLKRDSNCVHVYAGKLSFVYMVFLFIALTLSTANLAFVLLVVFYALYSINLTGNCWNNCYFSKCMTMYQAPTGKCVLLFASTHTSLNVFVCVALWIEQKHTSKTISYVSDFWLISLL